MVDLYARLVNNVFCEDLSKVVPMSRIKCVKTGCKTGVKNALKHEVVSIATFASSSNPLHICIWKEKFAQNQTMMKFRLQLHVIRLQAP